MPVVDEFALKFDKGWGLQIESERQLKAALDAEKRRVEKELVDERRRVEASR